MKNCLNCQDNTRIFQLLIYWDCYRHWWKFKHGRQLSRSKAVYWHLVVYKWENLGELQVTISLFICDFNGVFIVYLKKIQCYYCLRWFRHFRLLSENTYRKKLLNTFLKFRLRPTSVGFRYLFIYMDLL